MNWEDVRDVLAVLGVLFAAVLLVGAFRLVTS